MHDANSLQDMRTDGTKDAFYQKASFTLLFYVHPAPMGRDVFDVSN